MSSSSHDKYVRSHSPYLLSDYQPGCGIRRHRLDFSSSALREPFTSICQYSNSITQDCAQCSHNHKASLTAKSATWYNAASHYGKHPSTCCSSKCYPEKTHKCCQQNQCRSGCSVCITGYPSGCVQKSCQGCSLTACCSNTIGGQYCSGHSSGNCLHCNKCHCHPHSLLRKFLSAPFTRYSPQKKKLKSKNTQTEAETAPKREIIQKIVYVRPEPSRQFIVNQPPPSTQNIVSFRELSAPAPVVTSTRYLAPSQHSVSNHTQNLISQSYIQPMQMSRQMAPAVTVSTPKISSHVIEPQPSQKQTSIRTSIVNSLHPPLSTSIIKSTNSESQIPEAPETRVHFYKPPETQTQEFHNQIAYSTGPIMVQGGLQNYSMAADHHASKTVSMTSSGSRNVTQSSTTKKEVTSTVTSTTHNKRGFVNETDEIEEEEYSSSEEDDEDDDDDDDDEGQ